MSPKISSAVGRERASASHHRISPQVQELHHRFRFYGKSAREWMRKCVLMLPVLDRERVWEKKGFGSLAEYAGRLSGMSPVTVSEGLRVLRAVEGMPDIMKVIEQRGINCVKPIVTLLTRENQKFWAEKVKVMSQHTLELYRREWERVQGETLVSLTQGEPLLFLRAEEKTVDSSHHQAIERNDSCHQISVDEPLVSPKKTIPIDLSPSTLDRLTKLKGTDEWDTLLNELMDIREKMLEQEKPEAKVTEKRNIPVAIERFVSQRSRGICEVGACAKKYTILHHIQRFASEKVHDPDRIVALCTGHERVVHLGLIEDETIRPREWKILEEADKNDAKYVVDQLVQKYRRPK